MRLLVVGAGGVTGRLLVARALARGHEVTALERDPRRPLAVHKRLQLLVGDARDAQTLDLAVAGQDAVISVVGSRARVGEVDIYSAGIRALLDAMERHGVRRVVTLSAAGVPAIGNPSVPPVFRRLIIPLLASREYADMKRMESVLESSSAEWTVLRPLWLRNGPKLGGVRLSAEPCAPGRWGVRRSDLAETMLDIAEGGSFIRQGLWVSY